MRWIRTSLLCGLCLFAGYAVRGDAQQTEPVPYAQPVQIKCNLLQLKNAMITQGGQGNYDVLVRYIDGMSSAFNGIIDLENCAIYPQITTP
jgi:hypothetical protein